MIAALTFDELKHEYRVDGARVPSVTQILDPLQALDGVPWAILEAAREFGSHVHLACHLYNMGTLDVRTLDPALLPYLEDWIDFVFKTGFKVLASEQRVYNAAYRYAGTADAFGEWQGTTWVVDIKSGAVPATVGAQLAAYQQAFVARPRKRLCVQLTGRGFKCHEQKNLADFELFLSALNIHNFRTKRKAIDAISEYA